jgi:hypothetical protein
VNIRQYSVPITFCSAYGDSGLVGMSSRFGNVGVSPYSDEEPANTRRFTPASRAATRMLSVASMLARFEVIGSFTDRGTDGIAAWWRTKSIPWATRVAKGMSARSPSMNSTPGM